MGLGGHLGGRLGGHDKTKCVTRVDIRVDTFYIVLPYKPNIPLIHSILSCKLFAYICKFLYLYTIILADIYA